MNSYSNTLQIKALSEVTSNAPPRVIRAIQHASQTSGVDFAYLIKQAKAESNFNPTAKAKTSSATGLYQFIDSTWLDMMRRYGEEYNLEIKGKSKNELLAMRKDPKTAAFMAAAFASENEKTLNTNWGGDVGATELYFAHFLGAGGASSFLKARDQNPFQRGADLFPRAAQANRNVFYDQQSGKPRTLEEIYQFFDQKFNDTESRVMSKTPKPPAIPLEKMKTSKDVISKFNLSDNIIMQRSQKMREAARQLEQNSMGIDFLQKKNKEAAPFFTLVTRPVDVMLLAQGNAEQHGVKPTRDKSYERRYNS